MIFHFYNLFPYLLLFHDFNESRHKNVQWFFDMIIHWRKNTYSILIVLFSGSWSTFRHRPWTLAWISSFLISVKTCFLLSKNAGIPLSLRKRSLSNNIRIYLPLYRVSTLHLQCNQNPSVLQNQNYQFWKSFLKLLNPFLSNIYDSEFLFTLWF